MYGPVNVHWAQNEIDPRAKRQTRNYAMKSLADLSTCLPTYLPVGECELYRMLCLFREEFDKSANEDTRGWSNEYEMRCS